jgi:hypothetical protein
VLEILRTVVGLVAFVAVITVIGFITEPEKTAQEVNAVITAVADSFHKAQEAFH